MKTTIRCDGYEVTVTDLMILWKDNFISIPHIVCGKRHGTEYNLRLTNSFIEFHFSSKTRAASFGKLVMFRITDYQEHQRGK